MSVNGVLSFSVDVRRMKSMVNDFFKPFLVRVDRETGVVYHKCPVCGDEVKDLIKFGPPYCGTFHHHLLIHKKNGQVWVRDDIKKRAVYW